jgi:hypothetical protein
MAGIPWMHFFNAEACKMIATYWKKRSVYERGLNILVLHHIHHLLFLLGALILCLHIARNIT